MTMRSALAMRAPRARQSMPQRDMSELAGLLPRQQLRRFIMPVSLGLILSLLVLLPIFFMFLGALRSAALADPAGHFTLVKLRQVYTTLPYLRMLGYSLAISGGVAAMATAIGVSLAWLIARTDIPAKRLMEGAVMAPLFLSPFVGAIAWLILASPRAGVLNVIVSELLGTRAFSINISSPGGILFVMTLYYIPYAYLTVSASLRSIDPSFEEASYLNGAGVLRTALRITLPVVRPAILSAFFFIFVLTIGTFAIPAVLGRGAHVPFLAVDIFEATTNYPIDYGKSAAIGTLVFWISLAGVSFYRYASKAARRFVTVTARGYRMRLVRLRGARIPAVLLVGVYVLLAIVLPYLALIYAALTRFTTANVLSAPWTLQNMVDVLTAPEVTESISNTLLVGFITPTLCIALGVCLAYAIRRLRVPGGRLLDYVAMFPVGIPGIVFATGIFWTYLLTPIYGTIGILIVAFIAAYLPFAYRIGDTALLQIDRVLEEASSLCGASHWRTASKVTLRLMRPALLSAWIMVFIFSVREVSAAILLTSSDNIVLSVLSWNYLDYGDVQKAAVIGLLQTVILMIGVVIGRFVLRVRLSRPA
ncbi:MAG TPA: iron ABC transporter permease [Acetobacteraceae bacterium]|jgi:iron(III) transport system permease protein|nr:iron ABC transporter permease [Acetobacteraceae bacterium]